MGRMILENGPRILHPGALNRLGKVRHVLFDFDGTLSVLRQGWEEVMARLMVEIICGPGQPRVQIEQEVRAYVERSTGTPTIRQMQWLVEATQRHGHSGEPCSAEAYKALFLKRLAERIGTRITRLVRGESPPGENMVCGAEAFVEGLARGGVRLYLASGTDHHNVMREASALGLLPYFSGGVFGALEGSEDHAKERVIQRILDENDSTGEALLVVGDGPYEIREGAVRGALTLGVACDEAARAGWDARKAERLAEAGADLLVADYRDTENLLKRILGG